MAIDSRRRQGAIQSEGQVILIHSAGTGAKAVSSAALPPPQSKTSRNSKDVRQPQGFGVRCGGCAAALSDDLTLT
jgi:hypothetical protein